MGDPLQTAARPRAPEFRSARRVGPPRPTNRRAKPARRRTITAMKGSCFHTAFLQTTILHGTKNNTIKV
ncbi:hypothetical protein E2C01_089890 [Portunus trituberculatus]|uniref:Uncharacterized protein n=1 Tax=Portunus trituberculatus TaxID=210409 RepID=A0A5B7JIU5_PORTR|nr:hypothetical protein [Portunus trituberculatus]